jgi:hypothetical protein
MHSYEYTALLFIATFSFRIILAEILLGFAWRGRVARWYGPDVIPKIRKIANKIPLGIFGSVAIFFVLILGLYESITNFHIAMTQSSLKLLAEKSIITYIAIQALLTSGALFFMFGLIYIISILILNTLAMWPRQH